MFRSYFLVRNGHRLIPTVGCYRNCSQKPLRPNLQQKYFIVEVKNDGKQSSPVAIERKMTLKTSIKEIPLEVTKDHWMKIYNSIYDIVCIYHNQLRLKLERFGVDDAFINSKKQKGQELVRKVSEKTPVKFQEFQVVGQEQWQLIKESETYDRIKKLPDTTVQFGKDLTVKVKHYWLIFEKSPQKEKIVEVFKVCITYGKKGALGLYKFYKDVVNAPVAKIKH